MEGIIIFFKPGQRYLSSVSIVLYRTLYVSKYVLFRISLVNYSNSIWYHCSKYHNYKLHSGNNDKRLQPLPESPYIFPKIIDVENKYNILINYNNFQIKSKCLISVHKKHFKCTVICADKTINTHPLISLTCTELVKVISITSTVTGGSFPT